MKVLAFISICFALTVGFAYAQQDSRVRLQLGEHTTLRVGHLAELKINHSRKYHVKLEGDAIVPLNASSQERGSHAYRAVHPGNATLLITPTDLKEGDCVDCVTRHCFITVVP